MGSSGISAELCLCDNGNFVANARPRSKVSRLVSAALAPIIGVMVLAAGCIGFRAKRAGASLHQRQIPDPRSRQGRELAVAAAHRRDARMLEPRLCGFFPAEGDDPGLSQRLDPDWQRDAAHRLLGDPLSVQLHVGDKVTATQTVNGVISAPSAPAVILYHAANFADTGGRSQDLRVRTHRAGAQPALRRHRRGHRHDHQHADRVGIYAEYLGQRLESGRHLGADRWSPDLRQADCLRQPPQRPVGTGDGGADRSDADGQSETWCRPIVGNDTLTIDGVYTGSHIEAANTAVNPAADIRRRVCHFGQCLDGAPGSR